MVGLMKTILDQITAQMRSAADFTEVGDSSAYVDFLDRVINEARLLKQSAMLNDFGKQFKPAGEPVIAPDVPRLFGIGQHVRTKEGYIGNVAGHDKHGKAIVNVVWQACEYPEAHLSAIPDKSVLDSMRVA